MFGTEPKSQSKNTLSEFAGLGGPASEVAKRMSDIESAFSRQVNSLDYLTEKVRTLRAKLEPVMVSVPENKDGEQVGFSGSPLSQEIDRATERVATLNRELDYILSNLQL